MLMLKNWSSLKFVSFCVMPNTGVTAENLAAKYNISRQEVDQFALRSQTNWKKGKFNSLIQS